MKARELCKYLDGDEMTGNGTAGTPNGEAGHGASTSTSTTGQGHCKGHRRQESMYAMTGLYSETIPEQAETTETKCSTTFCHDTVIKCHSRNPSASFDRDKAAHTATYTQQPVIIRNSKECGILRCRPSCLQRCAGIKVRFCWEYKDIILCSYFLE